MIRYGVLITLFTFTMIPGREIQAADNKENEMTAFDLGGLDWTLCGWRPNSWLLFRSFETGQTLQAEVGPIPAKTPGSVQQALMDAGVLKDWRQGLNSRDYAWVEDYHWQYHADIPAGALVGDGPFILCAEGLDYAGRIYVDGKEAALFNGTFTNHRIDITACLADRPTHTIDIFFEGAPPEQGQIGYTSRTRYIKPRFAYGWDWCPRLVPIGVWDSMTIRHGLDAILEMREANASLAEDLSTGSVSTIVTASNAVPQPLRIKVELFDEERSIVANETAMNTRETRVTLDCPNVEPWFPNGLGAPKCYRLAVTAISSDGSVQWRREKQIGFRRIEWRPCDGAPANALPWICVVNGQPVFLQGVNWSPIRPLYPDTRDDEYALRVRLYAEMGANCFRVNGVGLLEKEVFYNLCDQMGILVWQDFPLSSSGVENWPPEDPAVIRELTSVVSSFILRRKHHPSLLMWCGGNELQMGMNGEKMGGGMPAPANHPCLAAFRKLVDELDPGRRFIPTTAFGALFYAHQAEFGKGQHHLVHGPWGMSTFADMNAWKDYWVHDDALFRSEVGMPGAVTPEMIRKYTGDLPVWPPTGALWKHSVAWWIQWDRYGQGLEGLPEDEALAKYCERTQNDQTEALAFAAAASKKRFPGCGGFLMWHGHDCFPCPVNNSLIDVEGNPKPVYFALRDVFKGKTPDAK